MNPFAVSVRGRSICLDPDIVPGDDVVIAVDPNAIARTVPVEVHDGQAADCAAITTCPQPQTRRAQTIAVKLDIDDSICADTERVLRGATLRVAVDDERAADRR